jgi:single-strand DNA-binding protein
MNNLNSILIEGNLVRDPLLRSTPKGTQVCNMCLASNRYYRQDTGFEKEVSFFDIETWSKLAEACYAKGKKGRGVRVVGRLKQNRWSDPEGKSHSKVSIVAEHVEFRPEFKKDTKPPVDVTYDDDYESDGETEENGEPIMAMAEKEVEAVAF